MNGKNRNQVSVSFSVLIRTTIALQKAIEEQIQVELTEQIPETQKPVYALYQRFCHLFGEGSTLFRTSNRDRQIQEFVDASGQILLYAILLARWKWVRQPSGAFDICTVTRYLPHCVVTLREWCCAFLQISSGVVAVAIADMLQVVSSLHKLRLYSLEDMVHVYEKFLSLYNKHKKKSYGVYYTPQAVVESMVRSIDVQLKDRFALSLGIASLDTWENVLYSMGICSQETEIPDSIDKERVFVQILDPATGTGTFLLSVIRKIRSNLHTHWGHKGWSPMQMQQEWSAYLSGTIGIEMDYRQKGLLGRLFACEVTVVPYCIAHFHLGVVLEEGPLSYVLSESDSPKIFLANYLDKQFHATSMHHTAMTVILGNPPYSHISQQKNSWIQEQIQAYKHIDGKSLGKKICLDDDYIKFIRVAELQITTAGLGLVHFITPHGFVDGKNFRGMRQTLRHSFDHMYFFDLHGNVNRKDKNLLHPTKEENIFAIKQGVVLSLLVKTSMVSTENTTLSTAWFGEQYGTATEKIRVLEDTSDITMLCAEQLFVPDIQNQYHIFRPRRIDIDIFFRYHSGFSLDDLFINKVVGIQTGGDALYVAFSKEELRNRMYDVYVAAIRMIFTGKFVVPPESGINEDYATSVRLQHCVRTVQNWYVKNAYVHTLSEEELATIILEEIEQHIESLQYRALDYRWVFFHSKFLHRDRRTIQQYLLHHQNIGVVFSTCVVGDYTWQDILLSNTLVELGVMATRPSNGAPIAPLYIETPTGRQYNLSPVVVHLLQQCLTIPWKPNKISTSELVDSFGPMDTIHYTIAVLYSPRYRKKYEKLLIVDPPKIPYPSSVEDFWNLVAKGRELFAYLLLTPEPNFGGACALYHVDGRLLVESAQISQIQFICQSSMRSIGQIWINDVSYVDGVHIDIWNMWIGGYQPAQRWIQDRKGRKLQSEELFYYRKMLYCLENIDRIMKEIDSLLIDM